MRKAAISPMPSDGGRVMAATSSKTGGGGVLTTPTNRERRPEPDIALGVEVYCPQAWASLVGQRVSGIWGVSRPGLIRACSVGKATKL